MPCLKNAAIQPYVGSIFSFSLASAVDYNTFIKHYKRDNTI